MADQLEQAFVALSFSNKGKNSINDQAADRLLKQYQQSAQDEGGADGIEEETKDNQLENRIMEEFINSNHGNFSKISAEYKLFDVVTAKNPS